MEKADFTLSGNTSVEPVNDTCHNLLGTELRNGTQPRMVISIQQRKISKAVQFINDNYKNDVSRDDAATQAGMSPAHFSRAFKKVMGMSYQDYLHSRRIAEARNLLHTTSISIHEIARFLGFSDQTGFGRIFKKLTGQTPSAYRNDP